ncbi:hypothetical protein [Sinomonas terrae]|uniref:ABC-2 type transport system permease protein n=1 Tax=Sinomonas terrae TaxID=2908838 RepID=A0ABS9TWG4_9MICC|nr:hypothetical protein [Sinomonas terrae]MCH6468728.1 hypothetical protein [Sinomonas terrae]
MVRSVWITDFRLARDFRAFEIVNSFRLPLSLGAFKLLASAGVGVGTLVGGVLWFLTLRVLRDSVFSHDRDLAWQLWSLVVLYVSAVVVGSGLLTSRRLAVVANPHLRLFRDLDLPLSHVALRYGVLPAGLAAAPLPVATALFVAVFGAEDPARTAAYAWLLPGSLCATASACFIAAWCALNPPRRGSATWARAVACAVVGLALGAATAVTLGSGAVISVPALPPFAVPMLTTMAMIATIGFVAATIVCLNAGHYAALLLPSRRKRSGDRQARGLAMAFLQDLAGTPHGTLVSVYYLAVITVCSGLVGASALLPVPSLASLPRTDVLRSVVGAVLLLCSCVLAIAFERIGPTAKIYHARFALESGIPVQRAATSLLGLYVAMALPMGALATLAAWLLTGHVLISPLAVALVGAAAETAGESLVAPLPNTDGSRTFDIAGSVAAYGLMTPCLAALVLDPYLAELLVTLYALALTLGAFICLRYRLSHLTSNSHRSARATIASSRSSAT